MRLVIDNSPEVANVISLSEVSERYRHDVCRHRNLLVDADKAEVECADCGVKLNPIAMLARFASEQTRWQRAREGMLEERRKLEEKQRCRCEHCGKLTRWRK